MRFVWMQVLIINHQNSILHLPSCTPRISEESEQAGTHISTNLARKDDMFLLWMFLLCDARTYFEKKIKKWGGGKFGWGPETWQWNGSYPYNVPKWCAVSKVRLTTKADTLRSFPILKSHLFIQKVLIMMIFSLFSERWFWKPPESSEVVKWWIKQFPGLKTALR